MPEHNGIRIALVSQYDALYLPEYHPHHDDESHTATDGIDTYIPNYTASQFWIRYSCDATTQKPEIRFFYFKLYVAGKFLVAWGCGAQDEWKGETSFVPSDAGLIDGGNTTREKLGLFFPRDVQVTTEVPTFEIRVHRAKARKRQERKYTSAEMIQGGDGGVQLEPIGIIKSRDPRRSYSYALSDPKDTPHACFRYHFRAHDELQTRGFVKRGVSTVQPTESTREAPQGRVDYDLDDSWADFADTFEEEDSSLPSQIIRTLDKAYAG